MDDILVLLLTIGLTVFAAINQSKKKRKSHSIGEEQGDFWEKMMQGEVEIPEEEQEYSASPDNLSGRTGGSYNATSDSYSAYNPPAVTLPYINPEFDEQISNTRKRSETSGSSQQEDENEHFDNSSGIKNFNLRDAVIYSEILRPKYF